MTTTLESESHATVLSAARRHCVAAAAPLKEALVSFVSEIRHLLPAPLGSLALEAYLLGRRGGHLVSDGALRLLVALRLQQPAFGRSPDLVHPRLFNDKIRWRIMYDRRPLLALCSNRLAARDYVAARAGEKYLVPLLGVFDRPEEIPWEEISPPYVVKATHGSKMNIIVRDAAEVDPERFEKTIREWLKTNYYHVGWEWSYKHVPRRIIIERFIGQDGKIPEDYKIHCFHGEPQAIAVCFDRFTPERRFTWRDPSWNVLTFVSRRYPPGEPTPPPSRLEEMLELSRVLSKDFDYIRVDLYCVEDRVYFGELTPTQASGRQPLSDAGEVWMGDFWHLPSRAEIKKARRSKMAHTGK